MKESTDKVLLIVRDGWGYSPNTEHNVIAQADTSYTDMLEKTYPTTLLGASQEEVGLPAGYYGNSEVGHMTMGAGRVIEQSLLRIDNAISDRSFFQNLEFLKAIHHAKERGTKLHLLGLLQKEGVHAHFNHLIALLELAKHEGLAKDQVYIHIITDGRDAEKQHAANYISDLQIEMDQIGVGLIVSMAGRYYAMDRNKNWDRTEMYYKAVCRSEFIDDIAFSCKQKNHNHSESTLLNNTFKDPVLYLKQQYKDPEFSEEFLEPIIHENYDGLQENDSVIFTNFRTDRAAQLTYAFMDSSFHAFKTIHPSVYFVSMTEYYDHLTQIAFPEIEVAKTLGQVLEHNKKTQLRISETEKYSHVTYFFDAAVEQDFDGAKKIIIDSPDVATFDLCPEMASVEITEKLITEINEDQPDFIICNFPNADMVGHTGDLEATKQGIEAIDQSLEKIVPVALGQGYTIILTADHGNAEYKTGDFETSHTHSPVPCTIVSSNDVHDGIELDQGMGLKNIAATVLKIMNIPIPDVYEKPLF